MHLNVLYNLHLQEDSPNLFATSFMYCFTYSASASLSLDFILFKHSGEVYIALGKELTSDLVLPFWNSNFGLKSLIDLLTPAKAIRFITMYIVLNRPMF